MRKFVKICNLINQMEDGSKDRSELEVFMDLIESSGNFIENKWNITKRIDIESLDEYTKQIYISLKNGILKDFVYKFDIITEVSIIIDENCLYDAIEKHMKLKEKHND